MGQTCDTGTCGTELTYGVCVCMYVRVHSVYVCLFVCGAVSCVCVVDIVCTPSPPVLCPYCCVCCAGRQTEDGKVVGRDETDRVHTWSHCVLGCNSIVCKGIAPYRVSTRTRKHTRNTNTNIHKNMHTILTLTRIHKHTTPHNSRTLHHTQQHGHVDDMLRYFSQMKSEKVVPDTTLYNCVLTTLEKYRFPALSLPLSPSPHPHLF